MKFKTWLQNEITLGSDGMRDNQPSQTAQATTQSSQIIQKSPDYSKNQANWAGMSGNTSALNKTFTGDVTDMFSKNVPNQIAKQTNAGNVAYNMSLSSPVKGLNIPKPKLFGMKKHMKKRMDKR